MYADHTRAVPWPLGEAREFLKKFARGLTAARTYFFVTTWTVHRLYWRIPLPASPNPTLQTLDPQILYWCKPDLQEYDYNRDKLNTKKH